MNITFKTKLKFSKSEETGELIAFVNKAKDGRLLGVREIAPRKVICVIDEKLKKSGLIKENVLYDVEMVKMNYKNGFVVQKAEVAQFPAKIRTNILAKINYQIVIEFGNRKIVYNPFDGRAEKYTKLENVIAYLSSCPDLKDSEELIVKLKKAASIMLNKMANDGYVCSDYDKFQ